MSITAFLLAAILQAPATPSDCAQRLSPHELPSLPASVREYLVRHHFTVPQSLLAGTTAPHNFVTGSFRRRGQRDWAVLCSDGRRSRIVVFWSGRSENPTLLKSSPDSEWCQDIGGGTIGYSRVLTVASQSAIAHFYRELGGPEPPPITHQGIEDAFAEKGSEILYLHKGRWLTLTGMD